MKSVVNMRSRFNVHLVAQETPNHSDKTACDIEMKGKRWQVVKAAPTCAACLKAAKGTK